MWLFCLFAYLLGVCVGFAMALFFVGIKNDEKYPREPPSNDVSPKNKN